MNKLLVDHLKCEFDLRRFGRKCHAHNAVSYTDAKDRNWVSSHDTILAQLILWVHFTATYFSTGTANYTLLVSLKKFRVNLLTVYCKLDHFSAMGKIVCSNEMVQLTERVSEFTPQKFQRVGSCVRSVEAHGNIVSKVPKWDNLVLRSADFYFSIVINFCSEPLLYLYSNGKKGK